MKRLLAVWTMEDGREIEVEWNENKEFIGVTEESKEKLTDDELRNTLEVIEEDFDKYDISWEE